MKKNYINGFLLIIVILLFLISVQSVFGQQQFANVLVSEDHVTNTNQALDGNLLSRATIGANSGLALGLGAYSGHLEIEFPEKLPANRTSYVRLDTEDDLLPILLGGNLGGLLADVAGYVLLGNQELTINVKNDGNSVLNRISSSTNAFATNEMRVVTDNFGNFYVAITPSTEYNRIRVENSVGSLVGLGTEKELDVYGAYYTGNTSTCLNANFTSFDGSGLTLDLLGIGGAGVLNPDNAIDLDDSTYSQIGLGVIGVAATMSQTIYFDAPSETNDIFYVTLGIDPSLLSLGIANNIEVSADNGSTTDVYRSNLSSLLDLDLLGLLTDTGVVSVPVNPDVEIDRIKISISSLLGVNVDQNLRVYDVFNAPALPEIDESSRDLTICSGEITNLIATTNNSDTEELIWYDAQINGNVLAIVDSGESYATSALSETTTYYVSSREKGCTDESPRVAVEVAVSPVPTADDITVETQNDLLCNTDEIIYAPTSDLEGNFTWFFDQNAVNQITNGLTIDGVTYTIAGDGSITIDGLDDNFEEFTIYTRLTTTDGGCENVEGDLAAVNVSVDDLALEANIILDTAVSLSELLGLSNSSTATINTEEITICAGTSIDLLAVIENNVGLELRIYDQLLGGNLIANIDSGIPFNTGILEVTTNFYIGVGLPGCSDESIRATITVNVLGIPTASDIEVSGADETFCSSGDVILVPSSDFEGTFEWFFDVNAVNQITDGLINGSITYSISDTGVLTISGLDEGSSPYDYFVRLQQPIADCTNADGDLKEVNITVVDSDFDIDAILDTVITLQDLVDVNNDNSEITLEGSVSGDVNEGDSVTLSINNSLYTGTLDANLDYVINVAGLDVVSDNDNTIELTVDSGICSVTEQLELPLPELPTGNETQVFCASDNPTLLDLQLDLEDGVFFDALVGGSLLGLDTPLVDGGVYFTGLLNLPIDVFARVAITVEITEVEGPTTPENSQTFCEIDNPIVGDITVDQDEVVFYDSAVDGNMLDPTDTLITGQYFVSRLENGCESEERLLVNVIVIEDVPVTIIGQTEEACITTTSYTYYTESNQTNYVWTITGGVISDGGTTADDFVTVTWNQLQNTSVEVSYLSSDSCNPNKELRIEIETMECGEVLGEEFCLEVFNEFSPNSDGFNDFFEIECITDYENTIRVYNRNGNLVFEARDYQNNWNGIANVGGVLNKGDHLPAGTYYYVVNIPELNRDLVGWLHLAR